MVARANRRRYRQGRRDRHWHPSAVGCDDALRRAAILRLWNGLPARFARRQLGIGGCESLALRQAAVAVPGARHGGSRWKSSVPQWPAREMKRRHPALLLWAGVGRSEERRVGKEGGAVWWGEAYTDK